ncbi:uncharacterized protein LOC133291453 [Gastrolobium bilobum]|uniref:uncharacterized protein LOC133291453 n=1 Tax=Gastrolobium bilobum TaxID=150636 RepID=UPI002AAF3D5A|nr:uncharacterized protein LOC133291453 [Gastrolobium bilobum]
MWDVLEVTHEGTSEVKISKVLGLTREFELFERNYGETIQNMQKRFTHIITHLDALGASYNNFQLVTKVLRSLNREWQPKVTTICESKDLKNMSIATLFGKLQEHGLDLARLTLKEQAKKKTKGLALQATSSKSQVEEEKEKELSDDELDEDEMSFFVKKYGKFFKKKNFQRRPPIPPRRRFKDEGASQPPHTCYECGKIGHFKADCPKLQKKEKSDKNQFKDKKNYEKKAYVAWDEDSSSSDDSSNEEANVCFLQDSKASNEISKGMQHMCFMTIENGNESESEVNSTCSTISPSYDELQNLFDELHSESLEHVKSLREMRKTIVSLEKQIACLNKEVKELKDENETLKLIDASANCIKCLSSNDHASSSSCTSCEKLKSEIDDLNNVLSKFTCGRDNLNVCLKSVSSKWVLDSGCSRHMTGDITKFLSITRKEHGHVSYGDNNKEKILGIEKVGNSSSTCIENVLLVDGLRHDLLSISQLCDKDFKVVFDSKCCKIESLNDGQVKFKGYRVDNIYMIDLDGMPSNDDSCLDMCGWVSMF